MPEPKKQDVDFDELFKGLVENACDFVERSVRQFKESPKHSLINFYTGLELFLKARLMKEHWSLLVRDTKKADRDKFAQGNFVSPSFEELIARLEKVAGVEISGEAFASFDALRDHRNMLVHFFHNAFESKNANEIKDILDHQGKAWWSLYSLLTVKWKNVFFQWQDRVVWLNELMNNHHEFLSAKYDLLADALASIKNKGVNLSTCRNCKLDAAIEGPIFGKVIKGECLLCQRDWILINCPNCSELYEVRGGGGECSACGSEIKLTNWISRNVPHDPKEPEEAPAWCGACEFHERSVVQLVDGWVCLCCGEDYDYEDISTCERCGERFAGEDLSGSSAFGCPECSQ